MKTLKELVDNQKWNGMTDLQVIELFFDLNNLEEEGISLIQKLAKIKIKKMKQKEQMVQEWVSYLPSEYLYKNYDLDTANWLHILELDYLSHGGELSSSRFKWAQENIPNIKRPQVYFQPFVEYLEKHDIQFKEEH